MNRQTRRIGSLAAWLFALALLPLYPASPVRADMPACIQASPTPLPVPAQGGTGGTGAVAAGGIGGTGNLAAGGIGGTGTRLAGGIGGTGSMASGGTGGTGIVGTITGFASVCVNGLEVIYDSATTITRNGNGTGLDDLALGQIVAIDAAQDGNVLKARQISILYALQGPVSAPIDQNSEFSVMGQRVISDSGTLFAIPDAQAGLRPGTAVSVAGFRDAQGKLRATRVDLVSGAEEQSVIGRLESGRDGTASLSGMALQTTTPLAAESGEILLHGAWNGTRLIVRQAAPDPSQPFADRARHIVAEGLVLAHDDNRHLSLAAFEVDISGTARLDAAVGIENGQRVRVSGRYAGKGRIIADRIEGVARDNRPHPSAPPRHPARGDERGATPPPTMDRPANPMDRLYRPDRKEIIERIERPERLDRPERIDRPQPGGR
jgi:hypothetical protein